MDPAKDHVGERRFGIEELFFSTTDVKGIIQSGNRVFGRVAAYTEDELVGAPHNIIRHPEMPRCVFGLLWDTIAAGDTIAAYVLNRAKTGEPYWVMATVVPCDGGFLSVRLKPSTPFFETAKAVYEQLRALERELGGEREIDRKRAMAASAQRLAEILAGAGFADYASFMHVALTAELRNRAALTGEQTRVQCSAHGPLRTIRSSCDSIDGFLDGLFGAKLDGYEMLHRELTTKSDYVLELAESLRMFSVNALLASTKLGSDGIVIRAVADIMRSSSDGIRTLIRALAEQLAGAEGLLAAVGFRVSVAKLQSQMASAFVEELVEDGVGTAAFEHDREIRCRDLVRIAGCLDDSLRHLRRGLDDLDLHLGRVARSIERLEDDIKVMRALEVNGRIEAARLSGAGDIVFLFNDIRMQIKTARDELEAFAAVTQRGRQTASRSATVRLRSDLRRIREGTLALAV